MTDDEQRAVPSGVHQSAARGYTAGVDAYRTGRPDYPPETRQWLRDVVGLRAGRTVLEVGAGSGAFTAELVSTGARVYALEPVAAMRGTLARRVPAAGVLGGVADVLPVRDACVDAIVCAQSFHWFATPRTLRQFRRVLAADGVLALVWNVRDERVPWVERLSAITDAYEGDTPRNKGGAWRRAFEGSGFVEIDRREAAQAHVGSVEQVVVTRTLSVSFIAALPPERQRVVEAQVRGLIAREPALAGHAEIGFPYRTMMYAYRRA